MKKVIAVLLGLMLTCSVFLGGCGDKDDGKITESSRTPVAAESSTNIVEKASSRLAEGATKASEKLDEAGSKVQNGLTDLSETLHNMASEAGNDVSKAVR